MCIAPSTTRVIQNLTGDQEPTSLSLTKAYLRGIGTDHIHSRISNYYPYQDNPIALPSNIYDSILKTPIDQDTDTIPTRCCPRVPKLETSTLNLLRLLALPFSLLNT